MICVASDCKNFLEKTVDTARQIAYTVTAHTQEIRMFDKFRENMMYAVALTENWKADNSINWDFVDADMYHKWSVLVDGETYTEWFNKVADEMEGV